MSSLEALDRLDREVHVNQHAKIQKKKPAMKYWPHQWNSLSNNYNGKRATIYIYKGIQCRTKELVDKCPNNAYLLILVRKTSGPQTQTRADFGFSFFGTGRQLSNTVLLTLPLRPSQQLLDSDRMCVTLNLREEKRKQTKSY